jgi:hypothetical protein
MFIMVSLFASYSLIRLWLVKGTTISYLLLFCWPSTVPGFVLTPWSRVILEKLTGSQLVKTFSAFYGTRRFITAFTTASHLSLCSARSIQSMLSPSHSLNIHLNIILPSTASVPHFPPPKPCLHLSSPTSVLHAPPISFILS